MTTITPEIYGQLHIELCDLARLMLTNNRFKIHTNEITIKRDSYNRIIVKTLGYKLDKHLTNGEYDPNTISFRMMPNLLFINTHAVAIWHITDERVLNKVDWDLLISLHDRIRRLVSVALVYGCVKD